MEVRDLPKCPPIARILAYTILPDRAATVRERWLITWQAMRSLTVAARVGASRPSTFFWRAPPFLRDDRVEKPIRGAGPGNRGQTGLPANFRQKAPEIHGSLVSPRRAPSPEGQFFMKFRGPKAHPNRPRKAMVCPTANLLP